MATLYLTEQGAIVRKTGERLLERLARLTDPEEDSVRVYRLCAECRAKTEILGRGQTPEEDPKLYVL